MPIFRPLMDDLHHFPDAAHARDDGFLRNGDDIVDVTADLGNGFISQRGPQAVCDGLRIEHGYDAAGSEGTRGIVGACGLDSDDAHAWLERLCRDGNATELATATYGTQDDVEVRVVL